MKQEYIQSQLALGKTHSQIIEEQPMIKVIGSIRGENLRNVVATLAAGLQYRLDQAPDSPVKTALLTAFRYMTLPDYAINLSLKENVDLLGIAVSIGLVTPEEKSQFLELASYMKPEFNITEEDFPVVWNEIPATDKKVFALTLESRLPEVTHIVIQMQDLSGEWEHATALHGVQSAKPYRCDLPYYGQARAIRWSCAYALDGAVAVV